MSQSILYNSRGVTYHRGYRLRVKAPDDFGVMHTIDFVLNGYHKVVEEMYSELGSINPSETLSVRFWMDSIDGQTPSEHVSFSGQWDLLYKVNKKIPRWQSLELEPTPIWFPRSGEQSHIKEASETLKALAAVGWTGPQITPDAISFQTKQCSSMTLNAFLMLAAFLAGTATSGRYRRRR